MTYRLEIASHIPDARDQVKKTWLEKLGFSPIAAVKTIDVFTFQKTFSPAQLDKITAALVNPITQESQLFSTSSPLSQKKPTKKPSFNWALEIGFLPGVTDNVATTTKEMVEDICGVQFETGEGVYTSQLLLITAALSLADLQKIGEAAANPLIQRITIKSVADYVKDGGMDLIIPQVKLAEKVGVTTVNLAVSDEELITIGKSGIANADGSRRGPLALDLVYMKAIQAEFKKLGRQPTDVELESIAQTWSEHCKHTIFADPIDELKKGLFKTYIKAATDQIRAQKKSTGTDNCLSVFTDNSGAIDFDDIYMVSHKVETHNSPSALDPFGGAITGIVGVNRDAIGFGLGAKPVINTYGFCFADPRRGKPLYKDQALTQKMLSPRRIMDGVISGVNAGGNCSGIPTPQGFAYFDQSYQGKPLVFVGTVGLLPKKTGRKSLTQKQAQPGDLIVVVGGRVGLDGIHGATFSSESLSSGSPATAVQIGDPITQKKLSDALVKEARDLQLYTSITDNGAGGLSCSVAEMAKEAGGAEVELEKIPLKYPGLEPWQIWISESQERMTLSVPPEKWPTLQKLLQRRGVEGTVIGHFTKAENCVVKLNGKIIMDLPMAFLHDGVPHRQLKTQPLSTVQPSLKISAPANLTDIFLDMLARPNIASLNFLAQQYDHEVQGGSVLKPIQGRGRIMAATSVTRPVLNSQKGVAISQALYPRYSSLDTYHMAACAIDTAIRNLVSVGANPDTIALLDNFCWCSSTEPERLWQLERAARACYDYALAFGTPFISGKDSMFNDFKGFDQKGKPTKISILPTLLISSIGVIEDVVKTVSLDAKFAGDLIYVLGETKAELAGSEYTNYWSDKLKQNGDATQVPEVNASKNLRLYRQVYKAIQKNLISASVSVTLGGLGIALAKLAMGGKLGIEVSLKNLPGTATTNEEALFSESQGRLVVTVSPDQQQAFEKSMSKIPLALIGQVTTNPNIIIKGLSGRTVITTPLKESLKAYRTTFKNY